MLESSFALRTFVINITCPTGIDGQADTRLISGIIAVEEKAKLARGNKVYIMRSYLVL